MKRDPNFQFPPSIQSDLWNYLKPEQQEAIKPILRVLKKPAQEELCCSLLDYMETGEVLPPSDLTLAAIYMYLTRQGITDELHLEFDKAIIRPLHINRECHALVPQKLGDIINSMFPFLNGKS